MEKLNTIALTVLLCLTIYSPVSNAQSSDQNQHYLFPVPTNNRWGYINREGAMVIRPHFQVAGQFSEGMAAVRLKGTYGYINETGQFAIPPQFDYALPFRNGIAKVFRGSKPYLIDMEGQFLFEHHYQELVISDEYDLSIVTTESEKQGIVNRLGELVIDTAYAKIYDFSDERAVVIGMNHMKRSNSEATDYVREIGVIDLTGTVIVPFGRYRDIAPFINGFSHVEISRKGQKPGSSYDEGFINRAGELVVTDNGQEWELDYTCKSFSEGLLPVRFKAPESTGTSQKPGTYFIGFIDTTGTLLFNNADWREATSFHHGRCFVLMAKGGWRMIDRNGEYVTHREYNDIHFDKYWSVHQDFFQDDIALARLDREWVGIDTSGTIIFHSPSTRIPRSNLIRKGFMIVYWKEGGDNEYRAGLWNLISNQAIDPSFDVIDANNAPSGLMFASQKGRRGYVDLAGRWFWVDSSTPSNETQRLNIDWMNRSRSRVSSPTNQQLAGLGGWADSENDYTSIGDRDGLSSGELTMVVDTVHDTLYVQNYEGRNLYISNGTSDTTYFEAQDSRLYLVLQAIAPDGNWHDIEYTPNSWCGNSYHTMFLPPGHFWTVQIPVFSGEFKTRLRAKLLYKPDYRDEVELELYSNEFESSLNPGQFWRRPDYYPSGIMDPYNE